MFLFVNNSCFNLFETKVSQKTEISSFCFESTHALSVFISRKEINFWSALADAHETVRETQHQIYICESNVFQNPY